MAFGDLLGTLTVSKTSVTNPTAAVGSVTVAVGDLIFAAAAEQLALTISAVTDNLGNSYTPQNAGDDAGNVTGRCFYSIATVGGTLTSVNGTFTAGSDDAAFAAAVFSGGPNGFAASPVDVNPANITNDTTTPYTCPATGTLAQASELVVCAFMNTLGRSCAATSPNLLAISTRSSTEGAANSCAVNIGYRAVAATTSIAPAFTVVSAGSVVASVLCTMSFMEAAGSSNKTLVADAGAFALTGTVATLTRGHPIIAGAGAYSLTGTAATLTKGHPLAAGAGSYVLTGTAASLLHQWRLPAAAGSYALTGTAATLRRGSVLAAGVGSYALTGSTASVLHKWALAAGAGSYALTGTTVTLQRNLPLTAGSGSYLLTGTAATLRRNLPLVAAAGGYALTGTDATLSAGANKTLPAGAGAYALSGTDATLTLASQKTLAAGAGSYDFTGSAATLLRDFRLAAEVGTYTLSGDAANLIRNLLLVAEGGSYLLAGADAALVLASAAKVLPADAGAYLLTGAPAALLHEWVLGAGAGSFALTGSRAGLAWDLPPPSPPVAAGNTTLRLGRDSSF